MSSLKEACGVFGILLPEQARDNLATPASKAFTTAIGHNIYYGLYALQHRGQESCGMAVFDHDQLRIHKDMGLVNQVFTQALLDKLTGQVGIGHTRYSTTGSSTLENAQPVVVRSSYGAITLAHNGNLTNASALATFLNKAGYPPLGDSDSHLMAERIRYELDKQRLLPHPTEHSRLIEAVRLALSECQGAFSVVIATGDTLIAARDPNGFRPFCRGMMPGGVAILASETCALDIVGAEFVCDIQPGELWWINRSGESGSERISPETAANGCVFELVYFARPDSRFQHSERESRSIYTYRLAMGKRLAEISPPVDADFVIPVPDSGNVAAVGYSQASGIPYMEGLIKNRYVGRTFIHPTQELRQRGIQLKLNPLTDVLKGKRVIVVDDSIVRGNTSQKIVQMLRASGVTEVHLRISSPPVKHPCFYGIDMSHPSELLANQMTLPEIQAWLGVESLTYLGVEDLRSIANIESPCMACFTNHYPAGKIEEPDFQPLSL